MSSNFLAILTIASCFASFAFKTHIYHCVWYIEVCFGLRVVPLESGADGKRARRKVLSWAFFGHARRNNREINYS